MAKAIQCRYKERGRRCRRNGTGEPSLCAAHRKIVEDAARFAGAGPTGGLGDALRELFNEGRVHKATFDRAAAELLSSIGLGGVFTPPPGMRVPPNWSPFRHQPPPARVPPPDPRELERARARRDARVVLGFAPTEPITEEQIKMRRRELAKKLHPDRGGSARDMGRVNDAADVLLAAV